MSKPDNTGRAVSLLYPLGTVADVKNALDDAEKRGREQVLSWLRSAELDREMDYETSGLPRWLADKFEHMKPSEESC